MLNTHRPNKTEIKGVYIKDMQTGGIVDAFQNTAPARKKVENLNNMTRSKRYRLVIEEGSIKK